MAFFGVAVAIGVGVARRRLVLRADETVTLLAFTVLALNTGRSVLWWALLVPPIAAVATTRAERSEPRISRRPDRVAAVVIAALATLCLMAGARAVATGSGFLTDAPQGITSFLAAEGSPRGRVFDGWWGSWFEFALPDRPMFVDARAELFPPKVWSDFFDVSAGREGWDETLASWSIDVVVASPEHQAGLITVLRDSDGWREAYRDSEGSVFVRA